MYRIGSYMGKKEYGKKEFRGVRRVLVRKNRCIDRTRKRGKKRKYRKTTAARKVGILQKLGINAEK